MPSIHMYSTEYIPYLIVLALLFFLGVCPTALLCIYSINKFRRKLNNCHRIQIVLNPFVETFQGTFKDGTKWNEKLQNFASILPALFLIIITVTTILASFADVFSMYILGSYDIVLLVLSSFLIAFARPCKSFLTNLSLSFHMFWSATAGVILMIWAGNVNLSSLLLVKILTRYFPCPSHSHNLLGHL